MTDIPHATVPHAARMTLRPQVPSLAETVAAFDRRSSSYDLSGMHHEVARQAADAAGLRPGMTLLDLAGGTGLVARAALPALGPDGRAVVLDAASAMLVRAKQADPRLHVVRGDAHRIPLADATVDRVVCVTALHLFTDPAVALREAVRVCRFGGRVLFTTWSADGWNIMRLVREAAASAGLAIPDPYAATGTPEAAVALAERAGLRGIQVRTVRHAEPLRSPDGVWDNALRSPVTGPLRSLPDDVFARVRAGFELALTTTPQDEHALLLVVGAVPQSIQSATQIRPKAQASRPSRPAPPSAP